MQWLRSAMMAAALSTSACGGPSELQITQPWVRAPATPGNPGAAYFTVKGGPVDATLIGVTADVAVRSEMHESMGGGETMATMKPIRQLAIPARATVEFKPGGRHVMLFDLNPTLKRDAKVTLRFTFANGEVMEANAPWVAAGQSSPWG